jgi:hypothetical protein
MSVGAIYMAKHRSGANDKTFVVGLVSFCASRKLSTPQLSAGPLGGKNNN